MPANSSISSAPALLAAWRQPLDWRMTSAFIALHLGALLALLPEFFSWKAVVTLVVLQAVGGLASNVAMHRLISHRTFKTYPMIEYLMVLVGSLNWQGGPIRWAASHRLHHRFSDGEGDPHSPHEGLWWAHVWWNCHRDPRFASQETWSRYAPDIAKDPVHRIIDRYILLWHVLLMAGLYAFGGWPCVVWGECVRLVAIMHMTGGVNAASHRWGYRRFDTPDDSRNLWWVALLSYGEWHHNHHAYPNSARHGLTWWELDASYSFIQALGLLGLAWDIRAPEAGEWHRRIAEQPLTPDVAIDTPAPRAVAEAATV